ncbi:glycosyltransferase family 2 protein [Paeniroseomonas aquatica]|uniref:Glycosyltransferase family 2 protein n=2 Tax=Paeniroseomonas aquatica TaxID=373043 RepID=A0ABT8A019_9PROT|nr:glycosyltransferase family 2 protein [Paeniroseomonas aquatica]MDN3563064.1 glycosyltransferase family 2 protein [Paeniroseomonas aquatica]
MSSEVFEKQLLDCIQAQAPLLWSRFKEPNADAPTAAYLICQLLGLYTEGQDNGISIEPFQEYLEITNAAAAGLTIKNSKARVFVSKGCKFDRVTISGANDALIFIGKDAILSSCDIACHAKQNVVAVGFNCRLDGVFMHLYGQHGFVVLSPGTTAQAGCNFCVQENSCLVLGSDSMLSTQVFIRTSDSHGIYDLKTKSRINHPRAVILHPHVWISRACTLNKGTEIGTHSVIGQGSVVHGKLMEHSVYSGSPVHKVRSGVTWDRQSADCLDDNHNYLQKHFTQTFNDNAERRFFEDPFQDYGLLEAFSLAVAGRPSRILQGITVGTETELAWLTQFSTVRSSILESGAIARRRLMEIPQKKCNEFPRIAFLMMQRDETSLLRPWLEYHSGQFGLENIFVWDNGSTDRKVLSTLYEYENKGLNVDYSAQSGVDFRRKGVLLGKKIKTLEKLGDYDFIIPIDCDEFLALEQDPGKVSINREEILSVFSELKNTSAPLGISVAYNNILGRPEEFERVAHKKTFFRSGTFKGMDRGYHMGESLHTNVKLETKLVFLHFHYKPYGVILEHSKNKLRPFFNIDNPNELKALAGKNRLADFILQGETAYMERFLQKNSFRFSGLIDKLSEVGVTDSQSLWAS